MFINSFCLNEFFKYFFIDFIFNKMQRSTSQIWTVANLKNCNLSKMAEIEKVQLKESRPTSDISINQECSSNGLKFFIIL